MDSKTRSIALLPALTIYRNVIRIPLACLLSSESTIRERVLTIHGIESSGDWQEDARAFAPHFACKTIKYPHYRWLGPLMLLLEPYVFLVLGATAAVVLFLKKYSSLTGWIVFMSLFLVLVGCVLPRSFPWKT